MSRVIQIPVTTTITSAMTKLNEELRRTGEQIVSTEQVQKPDGSTILMVSVNSATVESKRGGNKNLLLDQIPNVFDGKSVLLD